MKARNIDSKEWLNRVRSGQIELPKFQQLQALEQGGVRDFETVRSDRVSMTCNVPKGSGSA